MAFLEKKILDYWHIIEFLSQDKFPKNNSNSQTRIKNKATDAYIIIKPGDSLIDRVESYAARHKKESWGNLTVYVGRIKRESCIEYIEASLSKLGLENERPERGKNDFIACAALQLEPDGTYITRSLSLSPIIWAMERVKYDQYDLFDRLVSGGYEETVNSLEENYFSNKMTPVVTLDDLTALYQKISDDYLSRIPLNNQNKIPFDFRVVITFDMYKNEDIKNNYQEQYYKGLNSSFFARDMRMILEKIKGNDESVPQHVRQYICSLAMEEQGAFDRQRMELNTPENKFDYANLVQNILHINHSPLGKWPTPFMPSFMQQLAINLSLPQNTGGFFAAKGPIFSVNGPPGTGKTTLLKEIIVNNIVQRAIVMTQYNDPDEAFESRPFLHGSKRDCAYSRYIPSWYALKETNNPNGNLSDYSIVVASSNNAAVENISKEIPIFNNDMSDLFNQDVYFADYAKQLFSNDRAWGLIAVPLGKKSNVKKFYWEVLGDFLFEELNSLDGIADAVERFNNVKQVFNRQLSIVQQMQTDIGRFIETSVNKGIYNHDLYVNQSQLETFLSTSDQSKQELQQNMEEISQQINHLVQRREITEAHLTGVMREIDELNQQIASLQKHHQNYLDQSLAAMRSVGRKPILFGKKRYQERLAMSNQLADGYLREAERLDHQINDLKRRLEPWQGQWQTITDDINTVNRDIAGLNAQNDEFLQNINQINQEIQCLQERLAETQIKNQENKALYQQLKSQLGDVIEIDNDYIDALLSSDPKLSADAHAAAPWLTEAYNKEREKLFFYALQLQKEFILGSKCCRDNLKTLAQYWGERKGDDKERIEFYREDREAFLGSLYQTLMLLVPVISTTFASVETFLGDVKTSEVIGTLIVDEAGQAEPQAALGALFRSKRAVVVGDPNQIEPIVSDELNLLKKTFKDQDLKPYIWNKLSSVQTFADQMNPFGTYQEHIEDGEGRNWVGSPLLVHRRCISPMFDISNRISYNNMMKQKTSKPSNQTIDLFIDRKSRWINIAGKEIGMKNHFVPEQAEQVLQMLEKSFSNHFKQNITEPDVFIISPFKTIVYELRNYIKQNLKSNPNSSLRQCKGIDEWLENHIGTIHTFQGKEANEVILLLGCDNSPSARGAVQWVNRNIVNVAATRAQYRLYVIGDATLWQQNRHLKTVKEILDTFALKEIESIKENQDLTPEEKREAYKAAAENLPSGSSFAQKISDDDGLDEDYLTDTSGLTNGLMAYKFTNQALTKEQLGEFGFGSEEEFQSFDQSVKKNLELGIKLFYFLKPIFEENDSFDASCCGILFCKALETHMNHCFMDHLKQVLPKFRIRGKNQKEVALEDVNDKTLMLGALKFIITNNKKTLAKVMDSQGLKKYNLNWWNKFTNKFERCIKYRNTCCHEGAFKWSDLDKLIKNMFKTSSEPPQLEGVIFEGEVGKKLIK